MTTGAANPLQEETIRKALSGFQVTVSDAQVRQIQHYMTILQRWNDKLNLTAIRDPLEILYRHLCESMFAGGAISVETGRLADIGSGPGFPGLPLKILRPELHVFLVESSIKKGTFLAELIRELGLKDAKVLISRYEELGEEIAPLDYVCSRAVGEFGPFLRWAASDQVSAARVILWIGGRDLDEARKSADWDWQEPILIPQSLQRYLLPGTKKRASSAL